MRVCVCAYVCACVSVCVCVCVYVCGVCTHNFDSDRPSAGGGCVVVFSIISGCSTLSIWLARLTSLFLIPPSLYLSLDRSLFLSRSLSLALSLFRLLAPSLACLLSLSHTRARPLSSSRSLSLALSHSLSLLHTHTRTHTRAHTETTHMFIYMRIHRKHEHSICIHTTDLGRLEGEKHLEAFFRGRPGLPSIHCRVHARITEQTPTARTLARPPHPSFVYVCAREQAGIPAPAALYASFFSLLITLPHSLSARAVLWACKYTNPRASRVGSTPCMHNPTEVRPRIHLTRGNERIFQLMTSSRHVHEPSLVLVSNLFPAS